MDDQKSEMLMLFGWVFAILIIAVVMLYPYSDYQFTTLGISSGVNLYSCKYSEPAPMGIVDYGVSSYGNVYNISTNSIQSSVNLNNLLTNLSGDYNVSIQLNVNIMLKYENQTRAYFAQNVILMDTQTRQVNFIDNIWNESAINASLNNKLIKGNGTVAPSIKNYTYYFYQAVNQTGDNITLKNNQTIYLRTNTSISKKGIPEIIFSYNDGYGWIEYDKVDLLLNKNIKNYSILINGFNYTPSYNFYDAGIILGGPGDGSNTTLIGGSAEFTLSYWNGNNFQDVQDSYDFGCDTEEGINNAVVSPSFYGNGLLYANISSGKNIYLGSLWSMNSSSIGMLYINSSLDNIIISLNRNGHAFNESLASGKGEFTMEAGNYIINAYSNSNKIYSENYTLKKETINTINIK
ncbi:MAG: thermopsin [Candidatus Parvarchaeota archaeon]|nr:thermopsin [Candidatus Parvarchaeota archaeon]MCW1295439.1 thermopsin [Candidatus Parvarchaeum tengchongense]